MAGEGDGPGADLVGDGEAVAITRRERLGLVFAAPPPDRPDRVNDEAGREVEAVGDHGVAGRTLTDGAARCVQPIGTRGAVDGPIDASAPAQLVVGRVDDRVDLLGRDVAGGRFETRGHGPGVSPRWSW
jgi:hypothetical protein